MTPLQRIDRRIRELKAQRKVRIAKALADLQEDKRKLRRGYVDPAKVLALVDSRARAYLATHHSAVQGRVIGVSTFCEVMGLSERGIQRARQTGWMTYGMADEICCRLGVPTVTVYPYEQMSLEVAA